MPCSHSGVVWRFSRTKSVRQKGYTKNPKCCSTADSLMTKILLYGFVIILIMMSWKNSLYDP